MLEPKRCKNLSCLSSLSVACQAQARDEKGGGEEGKGKGPKETRSPKSTREDPKETPRGKPANRKPRTHKGKPEGGHAREGERGGPKETHETPGTKENQGGGRAGKAHHVSEAIAIPLQTSPQQFIPNKCITGLSRAATSETQSNGGISRK